MARSDTTPGLQHADKLRDTDPNRQLTIGVSLALRNQPQLDSFIAQVSDSKSPRYGHYLTPTQFAANYGPTQTQIQPVIDHLRASGLVVGSVSSNGTIVEAIGSVAAAETAFGVTISDWHDRDQNRDFYGNDNQPTLPAALASYVVGIAGLNSHYPLQRLGPSPVAPPGGGPAGGYTPNDLKKAYDVTPLASAGYDGTGQPLGLFELDGFRQSNITTYDTQYGLGSPAPTRVLVSGGPGPLDGGEIEVELDIEVMHAIASASPVTVWEGPNSDPGANATYNAMVTSNTTKSNSTSWGICEPNTTSAEMTTLDNIFKQAAAQGQSFFSASGDNGAYDCGDNRLTVDSPANDPYMTSTGGTNLALNADSSYKSESAWSNPNTLIGTGGGLSGYFARPSWQTGPGVANTYSNGKRQVPDVALDADPQTGYSVYVTYMGVTGWNVVGGTSAAAPAWAAFTGVYDQYAAAYSKPNLGYANPTLYSTGSNVQAYAPYHDVTAGDNLYYAATNNWDYATGWGSFDANNLARDLAGTLAITSVQASNITDSSAVITWQTDHSATSQVDYGTTTSYGSRVVDTTNTTNHSVTLSGLTNSTNYHFKATSTDSYGNSRSSSDGTFATAGPCSSVTLAANPASPEPVGTAVNFSASTSGCVSPQYRFWLQSPSGAWAIAQDYGSSPTFNWNTSGLSLGTYVIEVNVHRSSGSPVEATSSILFSLAAAPCSAATLTALPASPHPVGTSVTFTAGTSGCTAPQYRFWLRSPSATWTLAQNYGTSSTFNWNTSGISLGSYTVQVDVHSTIGSPAETSSSLLYTLTAAPCSSATLTAVPGSPQPVGTSVTFTAGGSGCSAPQYRFWLRSPGGAWSLVQDYGSSSIFNWNTTGLPLGSYVLQVDVHATAGSPPDTTASLTYSLS